MSGWTTNPLGAKEAAFDRIITPVAIGAVPPNPASKPQRSVTQEQERGASEGMIAFGDSSPATVPA
jgi:hypothetical protein